ncbi:hypothetical protein GGR57DRAFT_511809 [Xylariaceae sp. FL1272]|nr:hypothetical protein GGR57DRAFT_511809 [Xylariaceae sp. FL1272]
MPVAIIPQIANAITSGGATGGWCANNPDATGCVQKRDILNTENIPRMIVERDDGQTCGVPNYNYDLCAKAVKKSKVTKHPLSASEVNFTNVPSACMVLATQLPGCDGTPPVVSVCGSACLTYTSLTDEQLNKLSEAFNTK